MLPEEVLRLNQRMFCLVERLAHDGVYIVRATPLMCREGYEHVGLHAQNTKKSHQNREYTSFLPSRQRMIRTHYIHPPPTKQTKNDNNTPVLLT